MPMPPKRVEGAVSPSDVFAAVDQTADAVAEGFAELDDAALGEAGILLEVKAHAERRQLLDLGDAPERAVAAPPCASVVGGITLLVEPRAVGTPALADPHKAPVLDGVGAILLDLHLREIRRPPPSR